MNRPFRTAAALAVLLFLLPISAGAAQLLIPVGSPIGLQLCDDTVTVAAFDENAPSPARAAGLKIGDEIIQINDSRITCTEDVHLALAACSGSVEITVRRGSRLSRLSFTPEDTPDGPRLGVYLRQGISGIGTVTYYDPETGAFAALGHGVNAPGGVLMAMKQGYAYETHISSVVQGKCGAPGQLKGSARSEVPFASILRNTPQGVFGISETGWPGQAIPTAEFSQIRTGPAVIRSTVTGSIPRDYSVEIQKIYSPEQAQCRNFLLKITDPELLALTGGIVQGMSGSPIIQDGKLVGAVTHVLVNDPQRGYGIFIENMLEAAG